MCLGEVAISLRHMVPMVVTESVVVVEEEEEEDDEEEEEEEEEKEEEEEEINALLEPCFVYKPARLKNCLTGLDYGTLLCDTGKQFTKNCIETKIFFIDIHSSHLSCPSRYNGRSQPIHIQDWKDEPF